jgi:succinate dehydrogenase/fumarate reductase flavoprotein subunit
MINPDKKYDLIVAGAGIGGLVAARTAQEKGASVLLLEKASQIGGSAAASGGTVWCARDIDEWLKVQPGGSVDLGQALIDGFLEGIPWLKTQAVTVTALEDRPYKFKRDIYRLDPDPRTVLQTIASRIEKNGGSIACGTSLRTIEAASGHITGVTVTSAGQAQTIRSSSLILATGGFQANPELRARYMGRWSDRIIVRGVPENTGDGFEAALGIGAQATGPFSRFYGHYLPAPPAEIGLHNFVHVKPDFSEYAITVNLLGERFDDEFLGDEVAVHSLIHQPEATGVLIFDDHIRRNMERYSQWPTPDVDRVKNIRDAGGQVLESASITELADQIALHWSVPREKLLATLYQYNDACHKEDGTALPILKSGGLVPIEEAPFYAIRVVAGATFTYGGVKVNADAEVLDRSDRPIGGLYAAGADCGGIYTRGYTGGLSMGLAFGRIAGRNAATYIEEENV